MAPENGPIDRRTMLAGLLAAGALPSHAVAQGVAAPERRAAVRRPSPMAAALIACWCEGFGASDRLRLTVTRGQALRVSVEGRSGEGFVLVRGFLAAGAAMECVATVGSASAASHSVRWSDPSKLPEIASISVGDPLPGKLPPQEALQLAAAILDRADPHVAFDGQRKPDDAMEAAVTAVMSVDPVRATWVKPVDRAAFGAAMRVLASQPALASRIGDASLWQGDPMAVVWPVERSMPPRQLAMVGQRVQASVLQASRVGAALDPLVLPPEEVEPLAASSGEVARAVAEIARLGGCGTGDPVVVGRMGVLAKVTPRKAPPVTEILRLETAASGAPA